MISKVAGAVATVGTLVGAVLIVVAMEGRRFTGYVSEAGVLGEPDAGTYQIGLMLVAGSLLLLAVAVRGECWIAAALLAGAGVTSIVSASVPCSAGCPLPPYEDATTADLVHGGASIIGVGLVALALAALGVWAGDRWLRWIGRLGAAVLIPLGLVIGTFMLAVGRGQATATLERTILAFAVLASVAIGVRTAVRRTPFAPP